MREGRTESSAPTHVLPSGVLFQAWHKDRAAFRRPYHSLSINPLYGVRGSFTQGELEGAKPASNQIKCRAKPCLARRAWSTPRVLASRREATIFVPQGGTKITTLFQAVEKAGGFFDSLKRTAQAVLLLYVKGKLLYFWRCWPHTCGQEVML